MFAVERWYFKVHVHLHKSFDTLASQITASTIYAITMLSTVGNQNKCVIVA